MKLIKVTDENKKHLLEYALSMYVGELCKYCKEPLTIEDIKGGARWCPWDKGRLAHDKCWRKSNERKGKK